MTDDTSLQHVQTRLLSDPSLIGAIHALSSDPLVQDILNDDVVLDAIRRGDYTQLLGNPKIERLMRHPSVQAISSQVQAR